MLTINKLQELEPMQIFAKGMVVDGTRHFNFTGKEQVLRWVAVRGGIPDWAVYVGRQDQPYEEIARSGDKVCRESNIRFLVNCTDEAFGQYR